MSAEPGAEGAVLAAMLERLETSQWRDPQALRAWQLAQATALLRHAVSEVPHYAALAERLPPPGRNLSEADWGALPLLGRRQVQQLGERLLAVNVPAAHRPLGRLVTSGSTGTPLKVRTSAMTRLFWDALTLREHAWHAREYAGCMAAIRYQPPGVALYPEGARAGSWGPPADRLHDTGPAAVLNVQTDPGAQLKWLDRQRADYLITYPSNALALAERVRARGRALTTLRELRLFGEAVEPAQLAALREAFATPVTDMYSANETGYMALQCREQGAYHVQSESVLVEILDEDGGPCPPGKTGRVVVTPLWNYAMPLLRYEIGDWARAGAPCACGRGLPVLERILGRTRNLLRLPDGTKRWPSLGVAGIRSLAPVVQCQVLQTGLDRLEARLVVERALSPEEEAAIAAEMARRAGYAFRIDFRYHDRLGPAAGGKFEEFKSLLE